MINTHRKLKRKWPKAMVCNWKFGDCLHRRSKFSGFETLFKI